MAGRKPKPPLYVLPHGIEVIGEYPARGQNRYARVRIRPHPFFPDVPVIHGGCYVRRSRAILAAKLGRALTPDEHAHHADEDRTHDAMDNIEPLSPAEHNKHHKAGSKQTEATKARISASLMQAIQEGRRDPPSPPDWRGREHSDDARHRISAARKAAIASGRIAKPTPPSTKWQPMPEAAKERIRAAKVAYWANKKGAQV